ncbi:hypothetical protein FDECE_170 [Fusarium decemcellulare]|nr:hypothetical protein FDECE_170 [Fusarium decemcellulare]
MVYHGKELIAGYAPLGLFSALRSATTPPRTPLAYLYHFSPAKANSKILEEEAPQCPSMAYDNKHRVEQPAPHLARLELCCLRNLRTEGNVSSAEGVKPFERRVNYASTHLETASSTLCF